VRWTKPAAGRGGFRSSVPGDGELAVPPGELAVPPGDPEDRGAPGGLQRRAEGHRVAYPEKLVGALETKKREILCDFESLKLAVMDAYDPEIILAASCRDLPWSGPLGFLQQMEEFREKLRVVQDSSPLTSRTERDLIVSPHPRDSDLRRWDSLRLRDLDRISVYAVLSQPHPGSGSPRCSFCP